MKERINIKVNKSKIYFTPLFNQIVNISYFNLLRNTYFFYDDLQSDSFCLLYKFDGKLRGNVYNKVGFTVYENKVLMNSPFFKGFRDFSDGLVLYEFELDNELFDYKQILLEGKYSHLPEKAKNIIVEFNKRMYGPNEAEYIRKVLSRDNELWQEKAKELGFPMINKGQIINFPLDAEVISKIKIEDELFLNCVDFIEDGLETIPEGSIKD